MRAARWVSLAALAVVGVGIGAPVCAGAGTTGGAVAGAVSTTDLGAIRADFDADGFTDLAVGVPLEDVGNVANAGAVHILYGSALGLNGVGDQQFHQNTPGIADVAEAGDNFGTSVAAANFNGDAFTDLAIGVPNEDGAAVDSGKVHILYGSPFGLVVAGSQLYDQNSAGVLDVAEAGDQFGRSLTAADVGRSGHADLVVGVPGEDIGGVPSAGIVQTLYGSPNGVTAVGNQLLREGAGGIVGVPTANDEFGSVLTTANFGRTGHADLAVGTPKDDVAGAANAGSVHVVYGSPVGLTGVGDQLLTQNTAGIADVAEAQDQFGAALTAANLGRSVEADLAVGVPFEDHSARGNAGAVHVLYGTPGGLGAAGAAWFTQATPGVEGVPDADDRFGSALAAGNFGRTGHADLAIGVPFEDASGVTNAGAVEVLYGAAAGVNAQNDQFLHQNTLGIVDGAEVGDTFGSSLTAANFGRGNQADLAVGVPLEDVPGAVDAGGVQAVYGAANGLAAGGNTLLTENSLGVVDVAESGDHFGQVLTAKKG